MMLFGCYRRGDANDPETYVRSIALVLALYDPEIVREVTDPRTGIMTTEKYMSFMPNAGELKVYCEAIAARRERFRRLGSLPAPDRNQHLLAAPEPRPGDKATVFVPTGHERYSRLVAWTQEPETDPRKWRFGKSSDNRDGIWISWDTWDQPKPARRSSPTIDGMMLSEATRKAMGMVNPEPVE